MIPSIKVLTTIFFLLVLSIFDIRTFKLKEGFIPSFLTTLFMIICFIFYGVNAVYGGIFGLLLGLFFIDLKFFDGEPDLKVLIALCMTMPNLITLLYFTYILSVVGFAYKLVVKAIITGGKEAEIPFIPAFIIPYVIIAGLGLL